jgi:hypothetical protein
MEDKILNLQGIVICSPEVHRTDSEPKENIRRFRSRNEQNAAELFVINFSLSGGWRAGSAQAAHFAAMARQVPARADERRDPRTSPYSAAAIPSHRALI